MGFSTRPLMEDEYKVRLDIFEGPLDLLLYLIKKEEVDIYDVSIERVTKQYLDFIGAFKILNIDLASEFIVMAANLMYLKSRTLLPKAHQPPEDDVEDEDDPRWELIRQLIEYKKFKDAAGFLQIREAEQEDYFESAPEIPDIQEDENAPEPPPNVGIFDLIRAFQDVLKRFDTEHTLGEIVDDRFTVGDKIDYLLAEIEIGKTVAFSSLFASASARPEVIVTFLALLELIKLNHFKIEQPDLFGDIQLTRYSL